MVKEFNTPPTILSGNIHKQLVQILARRIVGGEYQAGDVLPPEDELRTQFDVRRNARREAVKVLSSKGLVSVKTKTGTQVQPFDAWSHTDTDVIAWRSAYVGDLRFFREVNEVRRSLEPTAAEYAALRATKEEKKQMRRHLEAMKHIGELDFNALTEEQLREFVCEDMNFHHAIFESARNIIIQHMAHALSSAFYSSRFITHQVRGANAIAIPLHEKVLKAIEAGKGAIARKRMFELMELTAKNIDSALG